MTILSEMQDMVDEWVARFVDGDVEGATDMYTSDGAIYSPYAAAAVGIEAVREGLSSNSQVALREAGATGVVGEHCLSPDFPRGGKWSSCAAASCAGCTATV